MSLLLVHGEEPYLIDREVSGWLVEARTHAQQVDVQIFDAPAKLDELRSSLTEVPLFDPERFILLRDPVQLTERTKRKADGVDVLASLLEQHAPTTSVCI